MKRLYSLIATAAAVIFLNSTVSAQYTWDNVGSGLNLPVHTLCTDTNNNILYAGGLFTVAGGTLSPNIAKWNGSSWTPVGSGILSGLGVSSMVMHGTDLIAGGSFLNIGGVLSKNIAKWNGTTWSALGAGLEYTGVTTVATITIYNGDIYAAGTFSMSGTTAVSNIAKWDGANWQPLGTGTNGSVKALCVYGNELYAAGTFTNAGGVTVNNIAKWNGTNWSDVGGGVYYTGVTTVATLTVFEGELYAGGTFTTAGTVSVKHLAKWDGTNWSDVGGGASSYTGVTTVATLTVFEGDLVVGGDFDFLGMVTASNIGKWDGSGFTSLGSGTNSKVTSAAAMGDKLFAGGLFLFAGGHLTPFIAEWSAADRQNANEEPYAEQEESKFLVYPNPIEDRVIIRTPEKETASNYTFILCDVTGRELERSEMKNEMIYDRNRFAPGLYIYKIMAGDSLVQQGKLSFR